MSLVLGLWSDWLRKREGYFEDGNWTLLKGSVSPPPGVEIEELTDNRGAFEPSLGLIVGIGKTFRSGYSKCTYQLILFTR